MAAKFDAERDGWGFTLESRKAHFFIAGESLCRNYGFRHAPNELGNDDSPDNCKVCMKKLRRKQDAGWIPRPSDGKLEHPV